jgi:hypothetical protein
MHVDSAVEPTRSENITVTWLHEETFGKPEPYQHVEHRAEQPRKRCG